MYESPARVYLKLVSEVLREEPFASIADLSAVVKDRCAKLKIPNNQHEIDKALGLLCGTNRFTPTPQTRGELQTARDEGRPMTDAEAREILHRIGAIALVKEMPRSRPPLSPIEIDGPIHVERVEHDYY